MPLLEESDYSVLSLLNPFYPSLKTYEYKGDGMIRYLNKYAKPLKVVSKLQLLSEVSNLVQETIAIIIK